MTVNESHRAADARWARQDEEVQRVYAGEFVVAFERRVVAHGHDVAAVLAEAVRETHQPAERLALVGIVPPLTDAPR